MAAILWRQGIPICRQAILLYLKTEESQAQIAGNREKTTYFPPFPGILGLIWKEVNHTEISNEEYKKYVERKAKPSPIWKNMTWAFFVGGAICVIGQFLLDLFRHWGLGDDMAGTAVSVTLILVTAILTGLNVFDSIAKRAGAGTLVPITGFANAMVSPAMEFRSEGVITGTAAKLFTVAGPVLVFGISAGVIYGLILALMGAG